MTVREGEVLQLTGRNTSCGLLALSICIGHVAVHLNQPYHLLSLREVTTSQGMVNGLWHAVKSELMALTVREEAGHSVNYIFQVQKGINHILTLGREVRVWIDGSSGLLVT